MIHNATAFPQAQNRPPFISRTPSHQTGTAALCTCFALSPCRPHSHTSRFPAFRNAYPFPHSTLSPRAAILALCKWGIARRFRKAILGDRRGKACTAAEPRPACAGEKGAWRRETEPARQRGRTPDQSARGGKTASARIAECEAATTISGRSSMHVHHVNQHRL